MKAARLSKFTYFAGKKKNTNPTWEGKKLYVLIAILISSSTISIPIYPLSWYPTFGTWLAMKLRGFKSNTVTFWPSSLPLLHRRKERSKYTSVLKLSIGSRTKVLKWKNTQPPKIIDKYCISIQGRTSTFSSIKCLRPIPFKTLKTLTSLSTTCFKPSGNSRLMQWEGIFPQSYSEELSFQTDK